MSGAAFPQRAPERRSEAPGALDRADLERCRAQDPMAFRAFVVRHERMVFALLSRMIGHGPEVEDLAQETFVRAFRAFPTFDLDGSAKVSTWLLTIATRLALDSRKRRKLHGTLVSSSRGPAEGGTRDVEEIADDTGPSTGSNPEISLERRELGRALADAAAKLPDDQRAALVLAELHGLSIAELSEALEVPENTAKTRLFRAREKMRAALAKWGPGESPRDRRTT